MLIAPQLVLARQYGNARDPWGDDVPSDNPAAAWILGGLLAAFWVWSIWGALKSGDYRDAFGIFSVGVGFAGAMWLLTQIAALLI
jgi:hypothetical protein